MKKAKKIKPTKPDIEYGQGYGWLIKRLEEDEWPILYEGEWIGRLRALDLLCAMEQREC